MKRKQLNLVLGLVAMGLLATVFLTRKKPEEPGAPLTTLTRESIHRIALAHPGAADIVLEKADSGWRLTAPVQIAADPFELNTLLGFAAAETRSTLDAKGLDRTELGLDPPKYTLQLDDTQLRFGEVEPLKYTRYVEVRDAAGDRVVTIDDVAGTATDADYSDLVSKALLPDDAQIASIQVPGLTVMKAAAGPGWTSVPAEAAQSSDAIQKFVDGWRAARSLYNQLATADEKPSATADKAVVTLAGGQTIVFTILAREPQLVLGRDDLKLRYTLGRTEVDTLLKVPAAGAAAAPSGPDRTGSTTPPKP